MKTLLKREIGLVLHPMGVVFLLLSAMVLIPNYPYEIVFFYTGLGVFFTCQAARENNDVEYALQLPISRRDFVRGRMMLVVLLQLAQMLCVLPFAVLRQAIGVMPNQAGMEANTALFGIALLLYGAFNLSFFGVYFKNVSRVGVAFILSSAAVFLITCIAITCAHAVPFVRDRLDTPDPLFLPEKLCVLVAGLAAYAALTLIAYRRALRDFARQDF